MTCLCVEVHIHASHIPVGHTIDADFLGGLRQLGKKDLEVQDGAFFLLHAEHLTVAIGICATRLIDNACFLVEDDALVATEP